MFVKTIAASATLYEFVCHNQFNFGVMWETERQSVRG